MTEATIEDQAQTFDGAGTSPVERPGKPMMLSHVAYVTRDTAATTDSAAEYARSFEIKRSLSEFQAAMNAAESGQRGLTTFSMNGPDIPEVKKIIRSTTLEHAKQVARRVMSFDSERQVMHFLREETRKIIPDAF